MISNYFKTAWRQLTKNKVYSLIKIGGLGASMAFCFLVIMFIRHELSFDSFHKDKEYIYRVDGTIDVVKAEANGQIIKWFVNSGEVNKTARLGGAVAQAIEDEIPGVTDYVRMLEGDGIVKIGADVFSEDIDYVDKNFFSFFTFPLLYGSIENSLAATNSIVLSEVTAKKYFGDVNPVGQTLEFIINDKSEVYTVSAVALQTPDNSSFDFNIVMPIESYPEYNQISEDLKSLNTTTFVKLAPSVDAESLKEQVKHFSRTKFAGLFGNGTFEETESPDELAFQLHLTKLEDIYFIPDIVSRSKRSDPNASYILAGIALLILFIGCTNYISLSLASSSKRSLEVGVRKVLGADRRGIAKQFIGEAVLVSMVSAVLGLLLAESLTPIFSDLMNSDLNLSLLNEPFMILAAIVLTIIIGIIGGSYPALIISKFPSVLAIAHGKSTKHRTGFVSALVGIQFALSSFLITSSVIMSRQMNYVSSKDVGYNPENVIVVSTFTAGGERANVYERVKNELERSSNILQVSGANMSFGRGMYMTGLDFDGEMKFVHYYLVESNYTDLLGIKIKEGRGFSNEMISDKNGSIIINETLAKMYGGNVIGKQIKLGDDNPVTIIGTTEDYNFQSLLNEVQPMFIKLGNGEDYRYILVKTTESGKDLALNEIRSAWKSAAPNSPLEYGYMVDQVNRQYEQVSHWQSVVNASTIFAVFIACLGLFGITGLQAANKTREIGIHKVLGAGIRDIVYLVNKKILITAGVAFAISLPFSIKIVAKWLEQFAFRIDLSYDLFLLAALMSLLVGVATVAFHSIRASLVNPVETLKAE